MASKKVTQKSEFLFFSNNPLANCGIVSTNYWRTNFFYHFMRLDFDKSSDGQYTINRDSKGKIIIR